VVAGIGQAVAEYKEPVEWCGDGVILKDEKAKYDENDYGSVS